MSGLQNKRYAVPRVWKVMVTFAAWPSFPPVAPRCGGRGLGWHGRERTCARRGAHLCGQGGHACAADRAQVCSRGGSSGPSGGATGGGAGLSVHGPRRAVVTIIILPVRPPRGAGGDNLYIPMVLNYIWVAFFVVAFVVAAGRLLLTGDTGIFTENSQRHLRLVQECVRDCAGADGRAGPVARHHEDRRAQRHDRCPVALAQPAVLPPVPRHTQGGTRPSGPSL